MTISATHSRKDYVGNGVLATYPFDFTVFASSDIKVYVAGSIQVLGVHYTVTGTLPGPGNVVFTAGYIPAADMAIIIEGDTPLTQPSDLNAGERFYEETIEQMSDRVTTLLQQIRNRSPLFPSGHAIPGPIAFPALSSSKFLRANPAGTGLEFVVSSLADIVGVLDDVVPSSGEGMFPAPGTPGRLRRKSDGITGLYLDSGISWASVSGGVINAQEWGFLPSATEAENVAAWNDNILSGMTVVIPAGTYLLDDTLLLPSNVVVIGMGMGITVIKNTSASKVRTFRNYDITNGNENIRISDLTIERTVLTGSYVAPSGNWNESIAFTAQGGVGLSLKNNWVERVHFYSSAVPANAGDKAVIFWGQRGGGIHHCVFDEDVDAVVTLAPSEGGGYTDLYITVADNLILGMKGTYAASALVGSAGHVKVKNNFMHCPTQSGSPTFIEIGDTGRFWEIDGNTLVTARGGFSVALAAADIEITNNVIVASDDTYAGPAISFSPSPDGLNFARRIRISGNRLSGGWIRLQNTDAASEIEDVEVYDNVIDGAYQRSGITVGGAGLKKNIRIRRNVVRKADATGIDVSGAFEGLWIEDNDLLNNGQSGDASYSHGIFFNSGTSGGPFYVKRNRCYDDQAVATQKWGIELDSFSAATINEFEDNSMWGNATAQFVIGLAAILSRKGNKFSVDGASCGRVDLGAGGTVTVNTTEVLAADSIQLTRVVAGGTLGHLSVGAIVAETSFDIDSSEVNDTSTIYWEIRH